MARRRRRPSLCVVVAALYFTASTALAVPLLAPAPSASPNAASPNATTATAWPSTYPPPPTDAASIAAAERLLGFGPLTDVERRQLHGDGLPFLPATLGTQLEGYARVRHIVASGPESVVRAPMAVVFAPPSFRPATTKPSGGLGVTSIDDHDASVDSIAPDDVADDSTNFVGDDQRAPPAPALLRLLPRFVTWACGAKCSGAVLARSPAPVARWKAAPVKPPPARPASNETLAFMSALELGALVRARKVTAVELVQVFTERLKR